jgi:hypothetical protein
VGNGSLASFTGGEASATQVDPCFDEGDETTQSFNRLHIKAFHAL